MNVHAFSGAWKTGTSGNWSTTSNWSATGAPGSTSLTNSTDIATFNTPAGVTVTIDQTTQNIGSIVFSGASTGSFTIGATNGNSLFLSNGGSIVNNVGNSQVEIIAAPLVLEPLSATSSGSYTFTSTTGTGSWLTFNGGIRGGTTTGSITLTLGATALASTINGAISNGGASNGVTLVQNGGAWILTSNANSYTGPTTVKAGTLTLTGSLNSSSALVLAGSAFTYAPSTGTTQTVNGVTLSSGLSTINVTNSGTTLNLGAITRVNSSMVDFNNTGTGSITTSISNTNGIIGPWAVTGPASNLNYAVSGGAGSPITSYSGGITGTAGTLANMTDATANYTSAGGAVTQAGNITGNTLQTTGTMTIATAGNSITLNGLLNSGSSLTISGAGSLTAGATNELDIITGNGSVGISSALSGAGAVNFASMGTGTFTLSGTSNHTGAIIVTAGTLVLKGGADISSSSGVILGSGTTSGTLQLGDSSGAMTTTLAGLSTTGTIGKSSVVGGNSSLSTLIINNTGTVTYAGQLGGKGTNQNQLALVKTGAGALTLSGSSTYTGGTTVTTGTLILGASSSLTANALTSGPLGTGLVTLGTGTTLENNGTSITLYNSFSMSGTITFASTGGGSLFLNSASASPATVTLTANTSLIVNNTTTIADSIVGNFTLIKYGTGTLSLTGTAGSTANTIVTNGNLTIIDGKSIGSGTVSLNAGTGLHYTGTSSGTLTQAITVSGTAGASATISNAGTAATLTLSGTLTKADTRLILDAGGHTIRVTGAIVSTGAVGAFDSDLDVTNGTTQLSGTNNTYVGPTVIYGNGILVNQLNNAAPTSTIVMLGTSTTDNTDPTYESGSFTNVYQLNGFNQSIAGLVNTTTNGSGGTDTNSVIGGSVTLSTLTLTGTGTGSLPTATFGGSGANANNLALKFNTSNAVTLTGSNTYFGGTEVVTGTLVVNNTRGSATGTGALQVDSGAVLTGTGTISSSTNTINGIVSPGAGGATTTGSLTLTATGTTSFTNASLVFNLSVASLGQSTTLTVGSTPSVIFSNATLVLNLVGAGVIPDTTQYTLLTSSITGSGAGGSIFSGFTVDGTGKISGLNFSFTNEPFAGYYTNSYLKLVSNGTGYNIDIEVAPEPGTWALVLGGLLSLVCVARKKKTRVTSQQPVDNNQHRSNPSRMLADFSALLPPNRSQAHRLILFSPWHAPLSPQQNRLRQRRQPQLPPLQ